MRDLVAERLREVVELLDVAPVGVRERDAEDLLSSAFSSRIRNSATGLTSMRQPGNVGSETTIITSSGSPSAASVSWKNP